MRVASVPSSVRVHLIGLPAAAAQLGVSPHTLRAWVRAGRIGCVRLGRRVLLQPEVLEGYVRDHVVPAHAERDSRRGSG